MAPSSSRNIQGNICGEWDCLTCSVTILSQRRKANSTLDWFEEMASFIMADLTKCVFFNLQFLK